jgi:hypothetical protein
MSALSRDAVLLAIAQAFSEVRPCGGVLVREAMLRCRLHPIIESRDDATHLDPESDWRDIPVALIGESYPALSFTDAPGFRFCLPAFMSYVVEHPDASSPSVANHCLMSLDPPSTHANPLIDQALPLFSAAQIAATRQFLQYIANAGEDVYEMSDCAVHALRSGRFG